MLELQNITKHYGTKLALDHVSQKASIGCAAVKHIFSIPKYPAGSGFQIASDDVHKC